MQDLSTNMATFSGVAVNATRSQKAQSDQTSQTNRALDGLSRSAKGLTEAELARIEAQKKLAESEMYMKKASDDAKNALGSFGKGILDTNVKLTNFNDALSSAGDAALSLGKAFGPLGTILGGLVKGFTVLMEANLKISQAYLEGKDQLNKLGAAGAHTTKELQGMARDAGLNAETLGRMIKPMQSMGMGIMSLGSTAGEGQKAFAKLIKTTDEERARMSRLGIDQEQMMQGQADYLALQAASGRNLKAQGVDQEKLRRSSLEYQTNLMELSALTGKDAQTLKDRQKDMLTNRAVQLANLQDQIKEKKLREQAANETDAGRKAELEARADALQKELSNRQQAFEALAGAPEVLRKGIQQLTTGTLTGAEAQILKRMPGFDAAYKEFTATIKAGGNQKEAAVNLQKAMQKGTEKNIELFGATAAFSDEVAKIAGLANTEDLASVGANLTEDLVKNQKKIQEDLAAAQEAGADPEADARAKLQEANIKATGAVEDLVTALNPFKLGLIGLTAAAGAAAIALGVMAKRGMLSTGDGGGMMDKAKGLFGGADGGLPGTGGVVSPESGGRTRDAKGRFTKAPAGAAGGGAAGIVQGLGQGGGNMLEGAAKGLKAFANPQVALGAAGFGVAIAAVGAGLAGATWIMGKALPTLSEGLESFTKLDGTKLKATGEGIYEIGKGMAVFGAGGVAAGIGGIIGNMSEGITKFFGGATPIDKLQEFSQLNIDGKKVKENAEAFTTFNEAMSKYKGGADTSIASAIRSNVVSFIGGDNDAAFTKFSKFSKINIGDPNNVKNNAQAFVYFSQALSEFKGGGELKNAADNIVGGIVKMFGGDDVMGKFVKFTKLDVDPDKALKLGQAFAAYTSALGMAKSGGAGAPATAASPAKASGGGGGGGGGSKPAAAAGGGGGGVSVSSSSSGGGFMDMVSGYTSKLLGGGSKDSAKPPSDDIEGKAGGGGGGAPAAEVKMASADAGDAAKGPRKKTDGIIVHHTGGRGLQSAISTLKARGLGYHYMVDQDGSVTEFVPGDQKAWHAGKTDKQPGLTNSNSVSISLVAKDDSDVSTAQLKSGFDLGKSLMSKFGASMVYGHGETSSHKQATEGKTLAEALRSGKIPTKVSADAGGLAMGPETGYPATLHGNEMIVPLDPNSFLAELGKKTNTEIQAQLQDKAAAVGSNDPEIFKELASINQSMMDMMATKLDAVIDKLDSSNNTQSKILKYSKA
jgi:hypothetical protein